MLDQQPDPKVDPEPTLHAGPLPQEPPSEHSPPQKPPRTNLCSTSTRPTTPPAPGATSLSTSPPSSSDCSRHRPRTDRRIPQEDIVADIHTLGTDGDGLLALVSLHSSPAGLSPTDREALLVAYANYRQSLKRLRGALIALDEETAVALSDQKIGMDNTQQIERSTPNK
jgi:hypothetical protein